MEDELPENVVVEEQYRIRRDDGMYSTGGRHPSWNKKGKVWKKLSHLRNAVTQTLENRVYGRYQHDCVIEKTTRLCIESIEDFCDFGQYLNDLQNKEDEKFRKRQEEWEREQEKKRYQMYLELKKEFEKNE
jgi:uncharacterized short protein YbdD (DUF466 family)